METKYITEIPTEEEEETFLQLIYISAATVDFTPHDLRDLLSKARANNTNIDVSGMLIFHEGSFFQVLEGPEENVFQIFDHISDDPRHDEVKLLLKQDVKKRSFEDWSMGFVNPDKALFQQIEGFADFFKKGFSVPEMRNQQSLLGRVMREFRDGKWRQCVE